MANSTLTYTLEEATAVVRMDDGKVNALSEAMIAAVIEALARAEKEATAIVLAGRVDRFCGGFDLRVMMTSPAAATSLLTRGSEMLLALYSAKVPLVIACTGHAIAGGALVLLAGDMRIGAAGPFRIGLNEVSIGLPVPILAMELARDRLLPTELTRATLLSQMYSPSEASKMGYLDSVVPPDEVVARAKAEAARLGALPRPAYEATKTRLRGKTVSHIRATFAEDMANLLPPPPA